MHETALVSACAWCTRWILSCGLQLAKVRAKRSHSIKSIWLTRPLYCVIFLFTYLTFPPPPSHPAPISLSISTFKTAAGIHSISQRITAIPTFQQKPLLPLLQSSCSLAPAPFTPFHPFWNHTSTLPPKRISTSLPLLLMRIHNLSPVAWTPIPQCGCLIGFGCGCTSGTQLQVVSS